MAQQDWFEKDFYAILGVPQDADAATIKKAYRRLARKHHPDQNAGDAAAEQRFKDIGEAHAVLADPKQREEYDAIRRMSHGGARFTAGGPGGAGGFEDLFGAFGGAGGQRVRFSTGGGPGFGGAPGGGASDADINDLLSQMFGGGAAYGGGGFGSARGPRKGQDQQARTTLSFHDAVEGATVTLTTAEGRRVTTRIPPGVADGQRIRLRGKGAAGDPGADPGDLILTVRSRSTPSSAGRVTTSPSRCPSPSPRPRSGRPCPCRRSTAARSRSRSPPVPPAGGCCGSRAAASRRRTATATCWPGSSSSYRNG